MSLRRLHSVNINGGFYHPGVLYDHRIKMEVGNAYIACFHDNYPHLSTTTAVAKKAKVGHTYASQVIQEFLLTGTLIVPEIIKQQDLMNECLGSI
jgi:hypothetical protein